MTTYEPPPRLGVPMGLELAEVLAAADRIADFGEALGHRFRFGMDDTAWVSPEAIADMLTDAKAELAAATDVMLQAVNGAQDVKREFERREGKATTR